MRYKEIKVINLFILLFVDYCLQNCYHFFMKRDPIRKSDEVKEKILELLKAGISLKKMCDSHPDFPTETAVRKWVRDDEEFGLRYTQARQIGLDAMADEVIALADEIPEKTKHGIDPGYIAHLRLKFDARRWYLSKLAPKRYGDRIIHQGDAEADPIKTQHAVQISVQAADLINQLADAKSNKIIDSSAKEIADD